MRRVEETYDVVVCGGGLAGFCAAVASARGGARTCLVQDRPVFGGNSSSEVRVAPHGAGAFHAYARETGIISELLIEERARNHSEVYEGFTNAVWDLAQYDLAVATPNLKFYVNTSVQGLEMDGKRRIRSVQARIAAAETDLILSAGTFIDCTGDGVVADLAGCEWRMGSEGRDEFKEPHAPARANAETMGNSIHFQARDMGKPMPFEAPAWAVSYDDPNFFYKQGRHPWDIRGGYWWVEIGVPWHTIHQAEDIRHELTRHILGVWDWIKNKDPQTLEKASHFALDWLGQVPGKRESRRIMGRSLMTEHDAANRTAFPDEVAYGGWFIDLHTPGGLLASSSEPAAGEQYQETTDYQVKSYVGPYGIPLSILQSKDVDNLMMAGRNVSVTHAALGTVRVMATTALMGQAVGTAAALALKGASSVQELQQQLLRDGCFLPSVRNQDPQDLALQARASASSQARAQGVGPESRGAHQDSSIEEGRSDEWDFLDRLRGQWIAVGTEGRLDRLEVCLSNPGKVAEKVEARLVPVKDIWDYRCEPGATLASTTLSVPPGERQWAAWESGVQGLTPGTYVRLDLSPNPRVKWVGAGSFEPGQLSAYDLGQGKMRRFHSGMSMSFKVHPSQSCYGPENVLTGVTRPHQGTNLWRSDPAQALPQWLQLDWPGPRKVGQVELTFPGHLIHEYNFYGPLYRDAQCASDYSVEAWLEGRWQEMVRVKGNYQRHRRHRLDKAVETTRVRLVIQATHGDRSAALYEIRCYS